MKIKTKLLFGLSILTVITIFTIGVGWYQLTNINTIGQDLRINYDASSLSYQIQREVKDEAISLRNIIAFNNKEAIQKELAYLEKERGNVKKNLVKLESSVNSKKQLLLVRELQDTNEEYDSYLEETSKLIREGNIEEAKSIVETNGYVLQERYFENVSKITDTFEGNMYSSLTAMKNDFQRNMNISSILTLLVIVFSIAYLFRSVWTMAMRLNKVSKIMGNVANGTSDLNTRIEVKSEDEIDEVGRSFNHMAESLEEQMSKEQSLSKVNEEQAWTQSNIAKITTELSGLHDLESIGKRFLSTVVPLVNASQAAFYIKDEQGNEPILKLLSSYAFKERKHLSNTFSLGEGLVGQAALEKSPIILTDVPPEYTRIRSALGEGIPLNIYVLPVIYKFEVIAVLELSSFYRFTTIQQVLFEELVKNLGIILDSTLGRMKQAKLLEETQMLMEELQAQSEELQSQQEELRAANEEMEVQTQALRQSEEKLQYQQEELEQTNIELREKAQILEVQNQKLESTNTEIEKARANLEEQAHQLALSSKYKSEFLANMSHELRTPLNSLLILSKLLADNCEGNLTDKQVEFSNTIYSSGNDLLLIINDILDLAKIESGKMEVNSSPVNIKDLASFVRSNYAPLATQKDLDFKIVLKDGLPNSVNSDQQRIQQVLKNLLSNAFKFTHQGSITLEIGVNQSSNDFSEIYFSISDTGIGIPKDKQDLIFEAFQQSDGTTSRKYGGTGLGLSICKQIASLLGGEIVVKSEEGKGSIFTFYVGDYEVSKTSNENDPVLNEVAATVENVEFNLGKKTEVEPAASLSSSNEIKRILIVDDDQNQRNSLMELLGAEDVIIKAVSTGAEAIEQLKVNQFDCMLLDLGLSDTTGFELLKTIQSDFQKQKIDIFIYTGRDLTPKEEIYLKKYAHTIIIKDSHSPQRLMDEIELYLRSESTTSSPIAGGDDQLSSLDGLNGKKILLVDDDVRNVYALSNVLEMNGMNVQFAVNGLEGLKILEENSDFDLVLMDIMMPEMDGYETIRRLREIPKYYNLPIIALTAKAMKDDREKCIDAGASDYIVKPINPDQLMSLLRVWLYQKR